MRFLDNSVRLYRLLPDGSLWGVLPSAVYVAMRCLGVLSDFSLNLFAYVQFLLYFGTPLPLRGGFPPNLRSRPAGHTQINGFFGKKVKTFTLCPLTSSVCKHPKVSADIK